MIGYRVTAAMIALLTFLGFSAIYAFGRTEIYYQILYLWGITPFTFPFLDIGAWLAVWECTRLGIDVVEHNPCDVLGRSYASSPIWIAASAIPLGVASTAIVGWILDLLFIVSLIFLPITRRWWELGLVILATLSPMVVFALERTNPDIILFMLAMAVGFLALCAPPTRLLSYVVALCAASLKYYPLTLMILSVRERITTFLVVNVAALCVIALFIVAYFPELARGIPLIDTGSYYGDLFSAKNLPFAVAEALRNPNETSRSYTSVHFLAQSFYAALVLTGACVCWLMLRSGGLQASLARLTAKESTFLTMGSTLIVGCFFAAQNVDYRGIYLLFVLPGMLAVSRNADGGALRAVGLWTSVLIVLIMWGQCIRLNLFYLYLDPDTRSEGLLVATVGFWFLREFAWWWVISILTAVLLDFVLASEVAQSALSFLLRRGESRSS